VIYSKNYEIFFLEEKILFITVYVYEVKIIYLILIINYYYLKITTTT
jgi:hypothetical protein